MCMGCDKVAIEAGFQLSFGRRNFAKDVTGENVPVNLA